MSDQARADALQALDELRYEFLAGPRDYPGLYHVLVQAADASHPMLAKLPPLYEQRLGPYIGGKYGTSLPSPQYPSWRHRYYGNEAGLNVFRMKAQQAAKHLVVLGPDALGRSGEGAGPSPSSGWEYRALWEAYDAFSPGYEAEFWLLVVHHLGWGPGPREIFSARRELWAVDDTDTRWYELPYEPEAFAHYLSKFQPGPPEFLRRIASPAEYFFSVLPDDLFRSSIYAIDMVLDLNMAEPAPAAKPPVWSRLRVDFDEYRIHLDGESYQANHERCLFVDALRKARGDFVSFKKIPGLEGAKIERVRDRLPDVIRNHIDSDPGKGSRLKVDQAG